MAVGIYVYLCHLLILDVCPVYFLLFVFFLGKSVLTEKPCAETYDEIKTCFDIAEREKKVLLTGFQRWCIFSK